MARQKSLVVALTAALLLGCGSPAAAPTVTPMPTSAHIEEYTEILDAAWQAVNDEFYDPTFGGRDWQAIGEAYRAKLAHVYDSKTFLLEVLNPMLFELGASHMAALPLEMADEMEPMTYSSGSLGMDVRLLDGEVVVTRVAEGSPAAGAGIRPGYRVTAVDGRSPDDYAAEGLRPPPNNGRHEWAVALGKLRSALFGEVGSEVEVEYLDEGDRPGRATFQMAPRGGLSCGEMIPALPPVCAELESERLPGGIAYLRFTGFLGPVLDGVLHAIDDAHDTPALIIDIRGNPGGEFSVRKAIASEFDGLPRKFMRYQKRDDLETVYLDIVPEPYPGRVVILVDELSASSSEEFSGSLQSSGRATIIGKQTQGSCLVAEVVLLPGDMLVLVPTAQSQTPDGRVLEGNGVVPDIEVALDRASLLEGRDLQLEAALDFLAP